MKKFKPLNAATYEPGDKVPFPLLMTPKIDGIRFIKHKGRALTKKLKKIPNVKLRRFIEKNIPNGVEGELKVPGKFNKTSSVVMSHEHDDWKKVKIIAFDYVKGNLDRGYSLRIRDLERLKNPYITKLLPTFVFNMKELKKYLKWAKKKKHEGGIGRIPSGYYKTGRSTIKEFLLVKFIKDKSAEARVIGFKQLESNQNKASRDEVGRLRRSSHKAGMKLMPMVGSYIVKGINGEFRGKVFRVGGLSHDHAKDAFKHFKRYKGGVMTYLYKPHGSLNKPRHARFKDWRKGY